MANVAPQLPALSEFDSEWFDWIKKTIEEVSSAQKEIDLKADAVLTASLVAGQFLSVFNSVTAADSNFVIESCKSAQIVVGLSSGSLAAGYSICIGLACVKIRSLMKQRNEITQRIVVINQHIGRFRENVKITIRDDDTALGVSPPWVNPPAAGVNPPAAGVNQPTGAYTDPHIGPLGRQVKKIQEIQVTHRWFGKQLTLLVVYCLCALMVIGGGFGATVWNLC